MSALLFEQHRTGGQSAHKATAKSHARVSVSKGTFKYMFLQLLLMLLCSVCHRFNNLHLFAQASGENMHWLLPKEAPQL